MSKFSKILIPVFLALSVSAVFAVFHFSNAQGGENNIPVAEDSVYICPKATSLEEINPLCDGIIVLNIGESKEGMLLTTTTYENREYYLVLGFKNGGGGEFGFVEKSIKGINDYIQSLPDVDFKNNPQQRKNAFENKLEEVFLKIENKEYRDAINKLQNDVRAKADGSIGGNSKDDWISDSVAQKEICKIIDDLIIYLKGLL